MAKVVLVGYGEMLYSLIEGIEKTKHKILGVFRSDRRFYNSIGLFLKDNINPSQDYTIIKSKKLYDIKGTSVNSDVFLSEIKKLNPDLIITGSWGEKFGTKTLNLIPCYNFHPALLPKNRGANPYFWTIYLNQKVTGLTIHKMDENFDTGDIISQEAITIDDIETGSSLKAKTCALARVMVQEFLDNFDKKLLQPIKQDNLIASYERQLTPEDSILDMNKPKEDIKRHLRALTPWMKPRVRYRNTIRVINGFEFLDFQEMKNICSSKNNNDIIEDNSRFFILKGYDFLIKIYK